MRSGRLTTIKTCRSSFLFFFFPPFHTSTIPGGFKSPSSDGDARGVKLSRKLFLICITFRIVHASRHAFTRLPVLFGITCGVKFKLPLTPGIEIETTARPGENKNCFNQFNPFAIDSSVARACVFHKYSWIAQSGRKLDTTCKFKVQV